MDRWDAIGAIGAGLSGVAIWRLAGWPWAALFFGALCMTLYVMAAAYEARGGQR